MSETLELEGTSLRLTDVERIARAAATTVTMSAGARRRVEAARAVVDGVIAEGSVVYVRAIAFTSSS
jgi:histidine ammonia-lyase